MVKRIGHRGASGAAPENTLASFRRAVELGADGVEFDVRRTRDGELVVIHDATLDRTTDRSGAVAELTLAQIREADAGSWKGREFAGERVPTLGEVIRSVSVELYVELKEGSFRAPGIEADLARVLADERALDRAQVSSFDHEALARVHALLPELPLGVLYVGRPVDPIALARAAGASALHPNFQYLLATDVAAAHRAGLRVHAWTPDRPEDIAAVAAMGVDGIMSNYPERIATAVAR